MRIVVGLSGGVDSALTAALLHERGWDVVGCFLKVELRATDDRLPTAACPWREDLPMAHRVAAHLDIPLIVKDVSAEYERDVLEPMIAAYRSGETPNPDATCNRWVKFDALRAVAREVSAERIATGHYARIIRNENGAIELHRGSDHAKDQSYFLWMLMQEQLAVCEFPLGEWRKEDVRAEAKRRGLPNWDRDSTSGVCFLGPMNLTSFLDRKRPQGSFVGATVVTTAGEVLGTVPSAEALTIGQRAPISGQPAPRYVVATEPDARRVVVSASPEDPARYVRIVHATSPHWIGEAPALPLRCTARIRHRQEPQPCTVAVDADRGVRASFDTPLTGVAPGQGIVFNDGDRILGGAAL